MLVLVNTATANVNALSGGFKLLERVHNIRGVSIVQANARNNGTDDINIIEIVKGVFRVRVFCICPVGNRRGKPDHVMPHSDIFSVEKIAGRVDSDKLHIVRADLRQDSPLDKIGVKPR